MADLVSMLAEKCLLCQKLTRVMGVRGELFSIFADKLRRRTA